MIFKATESYYDLQEAMKKLQERNHETKGKNLLEDSANDPRRSPTQADSAGLGRVLRHS